MRDLAALPGSEIVSVLQDAGLAYQSPQADEAESAFLWGRWAGLVSGLPGTSPETAGEGIPCLVDVYATGGAPIAETDECTSEDAAPAAGEVVGVEARWSFVEVVWDETTDVADALMGAAGLSGALGEGYVRGWDDDGGFSWMRVGACTIHGQPAYWVIRVSSDGDGTAEVRLSVDLLSGLLPGAGFGSYDELVREVFGR